MGVLLSHSGPGGSVSPGWQQAWREGLVITLCLFGAQLLRFGGADISNGILPEAISTLPFVGHKGFVCPLCGGMRAFVSVCQLHFTAALHYSILGTIISFWLLLTLPVRLWLAIRPTSQAGGLCYWLVRRAENADLLMVSMAAGMWLQLYLHYCIGFAWYPLQHLLRG